MKKFLLFLSLIILFASVVFALDTPSIWYKFENNVDNDGISNVETEAKSGCAYWSNDTIEGSYAIYCKAGSYGYVNISNFDPYAYNGTVCSWVKHLEIGDKGATILGNLAISYQSGAQANTYSSVTNTPKVQLDGRTPTHELVQYLPDNSYEFLEWAHYCFTWNGTRGSVYVNGIEKAKDDWGYYSRTGGPYDWNSINNAGAYGYLDGRGNNLYDDWRYWNGTVLNNAEILDVYNFLSNNAPTQTTPILNTTSGTNQTTEDLFAYNQSTADADGNNVTNYYDWYVNGTLSVQNGSKILPYASTTIGDNWSVTITPSDGTLNGTALSSLNLTIQTLDFYITTPSNNSIHILDNTVQINWSFDSSGAYGADFYAHIDINNEVNGQLIYNNWSITDRGFSWDTTANGSIAYGNNTIYIYGCDAISCTTNESIEIIVGDYPVFGTYYNESSINIFPAIGDTMILNATVTTPVGGIDWCMLTMNDTLGGTYFNYTNTSTAEFTRTISENNTANRSSVGWGVWCYNDLGIGILSDILNFTVFDVTLPTIDITGVGTNINVNNRSVVSAKSYNVTINFTITDYNIFGVSINTSCDDYGEVDYFELIDINDTPIYSKLQTINISTLPLQRCRVEIKASDDHTDKLIPIYETIKNESWVKFDTKISNIELSVENENIRDKAWWEFYKEDNIITTKIDDRYLWKFNFEEAKNQRTFKIKSDNRLIYREKSKYPAHFISWDEETFTGNWIDFLSDDLKNANYNIKKINDFEYDIIINNDKPISTMEFQSIGGTTTNNATYWFYVGSSINVSTLNLYDNSRFDDFNVTLTATDTPLGTISTDFNIGGYDGLIENISNASWTLDFHKTGYLSNTFYKNITADNLSLHQEWATGQSYATYISKAVESATALNDTNYSIIISPGTFQTIVNTNVSIFYMQYWNASDYSVHVNKTGYESLDTTTTRIAETNETVYFDLPFLASFLLIDEKTLDPFDIASTNTTEFHLFCSNGDVFVTTINNTSPNISISCSYDKFRFVVDYDTIRYYRTFILTPDESLQYPIYLIDFYTTPYVKNEIIADDLLSQYEDIEIWVLKNINDSQIQITADQYDIESKVVAWLIENDQYILEVHSSNLPIKYMGTYTASEDGVKNLRLYDIGIDGPSSSFANDVTYITDFDNTTSSAYLVYNDTQNLTTSLTWTLYENEIGGVVIATYTQLDTSETTLTESLAGTLYENSTLVSTITVIRSDGVGGGTFGRVIQWATNLNESFDKIKVTLAGYVGENFLNLFIMFMLTVLAMSFTIRTSKIGAVAIAGAALFLSVIGWFAVAGYVLTVVIIIAVFALLRKGDKMSGRE